MSQLHNEFLPFAKPTITEEAIQEVVDCLRSGWLTTGPRVQKFEAMLCDYFNVPYAPTLTSATAGLQLALMSLDLKEGDEVITTPLTFVATLNTIVQAGGKPILVDIDPTTYNIDVSKIESAITPRTRAIMPVHFAGLAVDLDPIYDLASKYNLRVIEDAAHAVGTQYKGKKIGSFGDIQVFSFHPNKNMTTGEGGCITIRDESFLHYINMMKFHGIDRAAWNRFAKQGSQHYDVIGAGYKYNMLDLQAAIGIHQLPALDDFIEKRTQLVNRYKDILQDWEEFTLPALPEYEQVHAWHLFSPLINEQVAEMDRDSFVSQMKDHNIGLGVHYPATHLYTFYQDTYGYKQGDFPHAENVGSRIFSLPLFPTMTVDQQDRVIEAMKSIFKKT